MLENITIIFYFFKPIEKSYTSLLLSVSHPENPLRCSNSSNSRLLVTYHPLGKHTHRISEIKDL